MNEIGNAVSRSVVPSTSNGSREIQTAPAEIAKATAAPSGAEVVSAPVPEVKAAAPREALEQAVVKLNEYIQKEQRDLMFSVDDQLGTTVVKVLDRSTGDLIRQIPNETLLDLARRAQSDQDIQLISTAG